MSPIGNVKLAVQGVPGMKAHPIRCLFDAGVRVLINSDDPFLFGNRLEEDYFALKQELGFTRWELARIARNGFGIALVDETVRAGYLAKCIPSHSWSFVRFVVQAARLF